MPQSYRPGEVYQAWDLDPGDGSHCEATAII